MRGAPDKRGSHVRLKLRIPRNTLTPLSACPPTPRRGFPLAGPDRKSAGKAAQGVLAATQGHRAGQGRAEGGLGVGGRWRSVWGPRSQ